MVINRISARLKLTISRALDFFKHVLDYNKHSRPVYTKEKVDGIKVHLGAGGINLQGWINVDARKLEHIHLTVNNFELREFSDNSISEIYLCHVLEHFSFSEAEAVIAGLHKKIKVGGVVRVSVPSFDAIVEVYLNSSRNLDAVKLALMGGQDYEYNYHKSVFNKRALSIILIKNGFSDVLEWKTEEDFGVDIGDWSNQLFQTENGNVPISLNLKGKKCLKSNKKILHTLRQRCLSLF